MQKPSPHRTTRDRSISLSAGQENNRMKLQDTLAMKMFQGRKELYPRETVEPKGPMSTETEKIMRNGIPKITLLSGCAGRDQVSLTQYGSCIQELTALVTARTRLTKLKAKKMPVSSWTQSHSYI